MNCVSNSNFVSKEGYYSNFNYCKCNINKINNNNSFIGNSCTSEGINIDEEGTSGPKQSDHLG